MPISICHAVSCIHAEYIAFTDYVIVTPHDGRYVPEDQRFEYNTLFEQLFRHASDLDQPSKLSIFACYMKEEMVKRLVEIVRTMSKHPLALILMAHPRSLKPNISGPCCRALACQDTFST